MEAKTLIENLIDAINEIVQASQDDPNKALIPAIDDARETVGLAKLILPSLDAPPPPPLSDFRVVRVDSTNESYGPFPNDIAAQTFIDNLPGGDDGEILDVHPPATLTGPAPTSGPGQPVQGQSYDEVLDELKQANTSSHPGSVISNRPRGSLYNN